MDEQEEEIRQSAHQRNDKGRDTTVPSRDKYYRKKGSGIFGDALFRDKVANYINSIPLDPTQLSSCPACEGVLCGLCGKCHELDRKYWRTSVACPIAHHMHQDDPCRAWTYAYIFLRDAARRGERTP